MKYIFLVCVLLFLIYFNVATAEAQIFGDTRCVNMWDEGCINGQLPGSGRDDEYVNGNFNPGKRCINMWDEGCINGQLPGSGRDDDYVNGGFNPGKRCIDSRDGSCANLPPNSDFRDHRNGKNSGRRFTYYDLLAKLYRNGHN